MIAKNILRINPKNIDNTIHFYSNVFGMKYEKNVLKDSLYLPDLMENILHTFHYEMPASQQYQPTKVCFVEDGEFESSYENAGYWKIGVALQNVKSAVKHLRKHNVIVNDPQQFLDVGFLTSCNDPNGYSIELLQHDFENNFKVLSGETSILAQSILSPPHIGQITIRSLNAEATKKFYTDVLSMKLVCVEKLFDRLSFDLYFYAYSHENPPDVKIDDVKVREWLYRQYFTQIEFQHNILNRDINYVSSDGNAGGRKIAHIGIEVIVPSEIFEKLYSHNNYIKAVTEREFPHKIVDPDGYIYFFVKE